MCICVWHVGVSGCGLWGNARLNQSIKSIGSHLYVGGLGGFKGIFNFQKVQMNEFPDSRGRQTS